MPSQATLAMLWAIWRQHRSTIAAIAALTVAGRVVDAMDSSTDGSTPALAVLFAMLAFVLLLGVFNYTDSSSERGLGQFPRRLFALPVTALHLVAVPLATGIASIELLYLLWQEPLSRGGQTSPLFVAVLLGALIVFYLWALWSLERTGALRLLALGVIVMSLFVVGQMPSFAPSPPPLWRSESFLGTAVVIAAAITFLLTWRHVARLRAGDVAGDRAASVSLFRRIVEAAPARQNAFATPAAAQFWYEWRSSGMALPALVAGQIVVALLPASWTARHDADRSFQLLLFALAGPIVAAIPVGMAFAKPIFWSEQLAVPAFVAVRPLRSEDLVAIKMQVAALSTVASWGIVLLFVAIWMSTWGNVESVSRFAIQLWVLHGQSIAAVIGIGLLVVVAALFLTWRALVSRLWSGLSGSRVLFVGSVLSVLLLIVLGVAFSADEWPGWLLDDPSRLGPLAWIAAIAVIAKYWLAAYTWRGMPARFVRGYLMIWLAGTATLLALGLVVWGMARLYLPLDVDRSRSIVILLALLGVPLARVGLAPSALTRNRHRS